jgi:hypothetical protein
LPAAGQSGLLASVVGIQIYGFVLALALGLAPRSSRP